MFNGDQDETVIEIPSNVHLQGAEEDEEKCRHCNSKTLFVDWAQGDRVCTTCGVVDEGRICDTRPEWKDFNDAEDLIKGLPAGARCGMVPVDESRYIGGLQPTSLSRGVFGEPTKESNAIRKRLVATNRRLDHYVTKLHNKALQSARLARKIRQQRIIEQNRNGGAGAETESDMDSTMVDGSHTNCLDQDVPPEYDKLVLREEEDIQRAQAALNADKWSLQRAVLLFGDEESSAMNGGESREELTRNLDKTLRQASRDLFVAYTMLQDAANKLQLPDRVTNEATSMMCKYVARRDGFVVKGVSSRLAVKGGKSSNAAADKQRNEALKRLKEHNKIKQMGSLSSALLFVTARNLGYTRSLAEVCGSVQPVIAGSAENGAGGGAFIKPKHCSRAMDEIKETFPDYVQSAAAAAAKNNQSSKKNQVDDVAATSNFVDHSLRKLRLPPVAEASVRTLVGHCRREQIQTGASSGTKLSTICASLAYFVCVAGSVMQRLAKQAQINDPRTVSNSSSNSSSSSIINNYNKRSPPVMNPLNNKKRKTDNSLNGKCNALGVAKAAKASVVDSGSDSEEEEEQFDVFTHDATTEVMSIENREYEMRRVWYTWAEQMPWFRTLGDVEHSCGVSGNVVLEYYKKSLYPRRQKLLQVLRDAVTKTGGAEGKSSEDDHDDNAAAAAAAREEYNCLVETPLASTLLAEVCIAGSIMQRQVQKTSCL